MKDRFTRENSGATIYQTLNLTIKANYADCYFYFYYSFNSKRPRDSIDKTVFK